MKILLIEDDDRIAEFLIRGLTAEGHALQRSSDGLSGFSMATRHEFDVIILDVMLPDLDGREICRNLRLQGEDTPILMLTALETTQDVVQGLRMGADDYLTKPFAFEELLARLEALSRRPVSGGEGEKLLTVGSIAFDTSALTVMCDGQEIEMTSLEYALLEFLMHEEGKVVGRARILENVWGAQEDPLTNVVDVYIRRLRKKLEPFGKSDMIKTIRGRGYRFSDS